ncbi:MAG TPA: crosslink repair DNA glycosylase YcaQ family protein, partial [Thermoanaerobaculia bacterium]|nr:crosslink repair DNA glycosylase YcaQ family protein [Thermoanaerobaculia bacterium]
MTANLPTVSPAIARRLLLSGVGLAADPRERVTPELLQARIEAMGFVQVDSINTVERAHHLILASRLDGYRPPHLAQLLESDRS